MARGGNKKRRIKTRQPSTWKIEPLPIQDAALKSPYRPAIKGQLSNFDHAQQPVPCRTQSRVMNFTSRD